MSYRKSYFIASTNSSRSLDESMSQDRRSRDHSERDLSGTDSKDFTKAFLSFCKYFTHNTRFGELLGVIQVISEIYNYSRIVLYRGHLLGTGHAPFLSTTFKI